MLGIYSDINFFLGFISFFEFQNGILYRGVSPDVLMFDQTGHLQVGFIMLFMLHHSD